MNTNSANAGKMVKVVSECPNCGKIHFVHMPHKAYNDWKLGDSIQRAWPESTPDERELLISGICPPCWEAITGEEG